MATTTGQPAAPPRSADARPSATPSARPGRRRGATSPRGCSSRRTCCCSGSSCSLPIVLGLWISLHQLGLPLPGKPFVGPGELHATCSRPASVTFDVLGRDAGHGDLHRASACRCWSSCRWCVALVMNQKFPGRNLLPCGLLRAVRARRRGDRRAVAVTCSTPTSAWSTPTWAARAARPTPRG